LVPQPPQNVACRFPALPLPPGWRYCLFGYSPRATSIPDLFNTSFSSSSERPFTFEKCFHQSPYQEILPEPFKENFLKKFLGQRKLESVCLDTLTIPIPLPAGGSHWVFDSQATPFPGMIIFPFHVQRSFS